MCEWVLPTHTLKCLSIRLTPYAICTHGTAPVDDQPCGNGSLEFGEPKARVKKGVPDGRLLLLLQRLCRGQVQAIDAVGRRRHKAALWRIGLRSKGCQRPSRCKWVVWPKPGAWCC